MEQNVLPGSDQHPIMMSLQETVKQVEELPLPLVCHEFFSVALVGLLREHYQEDKRHIDRQSKPEGWEVVLKIHASYVDEIMPDQLVDRERDVEATLNGHVVANNGK